MDLVPGAWSLRDQPRSIVWGGAGFAERPPPTFVLGEDPIVFEQPGHLDFELRYPAVLLTRRLHSFGFECSAQPPTRRVRRSDLRRSVRAWYLHLYEAPKAARTVGPRPREPLALWSSLRLPLRGSLCAEQSSAKQRARAAARATHPQSQQVVIDLYIVEAEGQRANPAS